MAEYPLCAITKQLNNVADCYLYLCILRSFVYNKSTGVSPHPTHMFTKRLFSSINSAALPLNSRGNLKIYSSLPNGVGFRLTNGVKCEQGGLAIIGGQHYNWNTQNATESIKAVLAVLRPLPEIVVLGGVGKAQLPEISEEFGCAIEATENKMTAAETFNTLIDDNRRTIGFWNLSC